jgi:hypothetical protein
MATPNIGVNLSIKTVSFVKNVFILKQVTQFWVACSGWITRFTKLT